MCEHNYLIKLDEKTTKKGSLIIKRFKCQNRKCSAIIIKKYHLTDSYKQTDFNELGKSLSNKARTPA